MHASHQIGLELQKIDPVKYKSIIERSLNNGYHCFKYDSVPGHPEYADCIGPKDQLMRDLLQYRELRKFCDKVLEGVYDDKPDEIDDLNLSLLMANEKSDGKLSEIFGLMVPEEIEKICKRSQHN